jgi:AraC-like DNA-binding protein
VRSSGETEFRDVAHQSRLGTVINSSVSGSSKMPSGHESQIQLVLPYAGLFGYSIGRQSWLVDPSKILLIQPGWEFTDEQPIEGLGHASLLVNPAESIVDEILGSSCAARSGGAWFGAARSCPEIWLLTHHFLAVSDKGINPLEADEWLIRVMELASNRPKTTYRPSTRTVARAKEFLHAHGSERVPLWRIANAVGVSPVYLTQEFTRSEGVPLYQYQLYLRLIRSLQQLRHCNDITQLALELGFSSHSHFSARFRRTFGLSPSEYRRSTRSPRSISPAPTSRRNLDSRQFNQVSLG